MGALLVSGGGLEAQEREQEGEGSTAAVLASAGAAVVTDGQVSFGFPPVTVLTLALAAKEPHWEFTIIGGRMVVVPGVAFLFGVETGVNVAPGSGGGYGGIVLSRYGTGNDAIITVGARIGVRPVRGSGVRYEARVEFARPGSGDTEILLATLSIGYDFGGR